MSWSTPSTLMYHSSRPLLKLFPFFYSHSRDSNCLSWPIWLASIFCGSLNANFRNGKALSIFTVVSGTGSSAFPEIQVLSFYSLWDLANLLVWKTFPASTWIFGSPLHQLLRMLGIRGSNFVRDWRLSTSLVPEILKTKARYSLRFLFFVGS